MVDLPRVGVALGASYLGWKALDSRLHVSSDLDQIKRLLPYKKSTQAFLTEGTQVADLWASTVLAYPHKQSVVFENYSLTFAQMDLLSNKIANWAVSRGFQPGDCVALNMENRPEFIISWLGLTKAGIVIALLNHNVVKKGLLHCIKVAHAKGVLFGSEVRESTLDIAEELKAAGVTLHCFGGFSSPHLPSSPLFESIDEHWGQIPTEPVSPTRRQGRGGTGLFGYIYTSGTTGLPKACKITHLKYNNYGSMFIPVFKGSPDDRIYTVLPLYHSAGGGLGVGAMVKHGCTLILKRKFSASSFWKDCAENNATVVQYIGELCRYLLMRPPSPADKSHSVRIAFGNGLRPEIWNEFQERFNISQIGEFYGATEGNGALANLCLDSASQGAVGRAGWLMKAAQGQRIVEFDVESEEPIRGKDGFCIVCPPDKPGELLFPIKDDGTGNFDGYSEQTATNKKVMTNVFKKGDKYFRTGDLLRQDANGYYFFVDRIGDTFRWKGENVSTMEVSEVISAHDSVQEANVYGVQLPGKDGRACMVALVLRSGCDLDSDEFAKYVQSNLPSYSLPLFVRFLPEVEVTQTFKHKKVELRKDGFDPSKIKDKMWYYDVTTSSYLPFSREAYLKVIAPDSKL